MLPRVQIAHGVDRMGVELCGSWLCVWVLVWEPGVLGVVIHMVLA